MHSILIPSRVFAIAIILTAGLINPARSETENPEKKLGIKIDNFGRIDEYYYRGAQPKNQDYEELAALGIVTVISLTGNDSDPNEKAMVEKAGMKYCQIPLSPHSRPTLANVEKFLKIINEPSRKPVFVHCVAGRHRTGAMTAIYRLNQHGWTADQAYKEMKLYKFGAGFFHPALKSFVYDYFKKLTRLKATPESAIAVGDAAN